MTDQRLKFLYSIAVSLVVVVAVDLFYSFAAHGLSEPHWCFLGGLSVVTAWLAVKLAPATTGGAPGQQAEAPAPRKIGGRRRVVRALPRSAAPGVGTR